MNLALYTFNPCHFLAVACIIASTSYMFPGWRCKNVTHYWTLGIKIGKDPGRASTRDIFNRQEEKRARGHKSNGKSVFRTWRRVLQAEVLQQVQWRQELKISRWVWQQEKARKRGSCLKLITGTNHWDFGIRPLMSCKSICGRQVSKPTI